VRAWLRERRTTRFTTPPQRYIVTLIDPQGLKVSSERPCRHPSCFWA